MLQTSILDDLKETCVTIPYAQVVYSRVDNAIRYSIVVKSGALMWTVEKRYSDFVALRKQMGGPCGGVVKAPFPCKGGFFFSQTNSSRKGIEKRRLILETYLQTALTESIQSNEIAAHLDDFFRLPEALCSADATIAPAWIPVRQSTSLWNASRYQDITTLPTDNASDDDDTMQSVELSPISNDKTLYSAPLLPSLPWASHRIGERESDNHRYNILSAPGEKQSVVRARWIEFCAFVEWFHSPVHEDAIPSAQESLLFIAGHRAEMEDRDRSAPCRSKKRQRKLRDSRLSVLSRNALPEAWEEDIAAEYSSFISLTPPAPVEVSECDGDGEGDGYDNTDTQSISSDASSSVGPLSPQTSSLLTPPRSSSRRKECVASSLDDVFYKAKPAFYGYA